MYGDGCSITMDAASKRWAAWVERVRRVAKLHLCRARILSRKLVAPFRTWLHASTQRSAEVDKFRVCFQHMRRRCKSCGLNTWAKATLTWHTQQEMMLRGQVIWRWHGLRGAIAIWRSSKLTGHGELRYASDKKQEECLVRLKRQVAQQKFLRQILHTWSRYVATQGYSKARRAFARQSIRSADAMLTRGGVMALLTPSQRSQWPAAWSECHGWQMTLHEVPDWLEQVGIRRVPRARSALLATMRDLSVHVQLIRLALPSYYARYREWCGYHVDPNDWHCKRDMIVAFLQTEHACNVLGKGMAMKLVEVTKRGRDVDTLVTLAALRVILEIAQPQMWERFLEWVTAYHAPQTPSTRDDADDTPSDRWLHDDRSIGGPQTLTINLKFGASHLQEYAATTSSSSTDEYTAVFEMNQASLFNRTH